MTNTAQEQFSFHIYRAASLAEYRYALDFIVETQNSLVYTELIYKGYEPGLISGNLKPLRLK